MSKLSQSKKIALFYKIIQINDIPQKRLQKRSLHVIQKIMRRKELTLGLRQSKISFRKLSLKSALRNKVF
ncbi:hypothetical protein VSWAT3_24324 [Vibrionales bacterium SWAT-3]|nr:hypothetical protein VSWAT3_24324 [Vibrionales bacterium SWAT-3]